jgi:outer membrane murein-binding lipoprotein Lpp
MPKFLKSTGTYLIMSSVVVSLAVAGCTKRPNAEQLRALDEQRNATMAAEDRVKELEGEKAKLQRDLEQKKAELNEAKQVKDRVQKRLSQEGG